MAAALARYAQAKADLDEQAAAGLTALLARVAARRPLGYPVTDEVDATNGQDRLYFQHGMIETVNGVATVYLN